MRSFDDISMSCAAAAMLAASCRHAPRDMRDVLRRDAVTADLFQFRHVSARPATLLC